MLFGFPYYSTGFVNRENNRFLQTHPSTNNGKQREKFNRKSVVGSEPTSVYLCILAKDAERPTIFNQIDFDELS